MEGVLRFEYIGGYNRNLGKKSLDKIEDIPLHCKNIFEKYVKKVSSLNDSFEETVIGFCFINPTLNIMYITSREYRDASKTLVAFPKFNQQINYSLINGDFFSNIGKNPIVVYESVWFGQGSLPELLLYSQNPFEKMDEEINYRDFLEEDKRFMRNLGRKRKA